jgi:hypothetical protein
MRTPNIDSRARAPVVGVRVKPAVREWILAEAQRRGVPYSQILRELLDRALILYQGATKGGRDGGDAEQGASSAGTEA